MTPSDPSQALKMAQYIAQSGLCPSSYKNKPQDVLVAAAMGNQLGLDVFASMQGIAIVNGRPSLWGDVLRSLILAHPKLENIEESYEGEGDALTAVCVITRKGMSPYSATFSVQDAKDAGLWGRNTWKNFSRDMLLNRAFGRAARRRFADALNGIGVADEMEDAAPQHNSRKQVAQEVSEKAQGFVIPEIQKTEEQPVETVEPAVELTDVFSLDIDEEGVL